MRLFCTYTKKYILPVPIRQENLHSVSAGRFFQGALQHVAHQQAIRLWCNFRLWFGSTVFMIYHRKYRHLITHELENARLL